MKLKNLFPALCLALAALFTVGCGDDGEYSQSQSDKLPPLGPPSTQSSVKNDSGDSSSFGGSDIDSGNSSSGGDIDSGNSSSGGDIDIGSQVTLDFFSINDLHGKFNDTDDNIGVDEMTTYLRSFENDTTVLLSAGDMWQGSAESNFTKGALIVDWMNDLNFAAMALGNHEFDWGESYIDTNADLAEFPFLAINVYDKDTNQRVEYCDSSVIVEKSGVQIGIIGAIGDCYSSIASSMAQGVYFKVGNDLTNLVKAESQSLRAQGADVILYVLHDDYRNSGAYDTSLSNGYVDLVFEGHTHQPVKEQDNYGVWHLQAGGDNNTGLSHAKVYVNTETGDVNVTTAEIVSYSTYQNKQDDPIVNELLEKYESSLTKVNEVVGYNKTYRGYDELAELAAEATYHAAEKRWGGSQYADKIVLGGGFLKPRSPYNLSMGNVTYGDLYYLFPFDNDLVLCSISGSRLKRQFLQTSNSDYHMYYSEYGETLDPNTMSLTDTYYVVVDTYTSDYSYAGMGPMTIVEYYSETEAYYTRDALADFAKAKGFNGGYDPDASDTPVTPTPVIYTNIGDIHASSSSFTNITARGEVIAVSKQSFLFSDNTGIIMFYTGNEPSVSVGDTVEVTGNTSIYSNNQQFSSSKNATYTVKTLDVSRRDTTPTEWDVNEVNSFDGKIGDYVKMTLLLYQSGSYYNASLSAGSTKYTISVINPIDSVLGNITLSSTPIEVVVTGYPCYIVSGKYLNVLIDSITPAKNENEDTMSAMTLENGFGGYSISSYSTGNYGSVNVNGVALEYYRAYTPESESYLTGLLPYFSSTADGALPGALYNTSPIYGIQSFEITYKSAAAAKLYTGDDRIATMTAYTLPASTSYTTVMWTIDTDNFFKLESGANATLYIQSITIEYTNKAVSYRTQKTGSGVGYNRLNATVFSGTPIAGQSAVSVPVSVEYNGGEAIVKQTKTYTYYTLEYVETHPSVKAQAAMLTPADVAAYYTAFKAFPANYAAYNFEDGNSYEDVQAVFGNDTRYVSEYSRLDGYALYVPYNTQDVYYYEFDIALDASYWESNSRGVGRVVAWRGGWVGTGYNGAPACVYTDDHYATFQEYLNDGAFGPRFDANLNLTNYQWSAATTTALS